MDVKTGKFFVSPGRAVAGELTIAGPDSSIVLRDDAVFPIGAEPNLCITGTLYDQTKITLIDCVRTAQSTHTRPQDGVKSHSVTLFPHFIAQGSLHLVPDTPSVRDLSFTFDDITSLFYDFDAFGGAVDATAFIDPIVSANAKQFGRKIRTGPSPEIAYFAGERLIMAADTAIGHVRVEHHPSWPVGGPQGVKIENEIRVSITPVAPVTLNEAIDRLMSLLRFIAIAVGRKQNLPRVVVRVGEAASPVLTVHWSDYPRRKGHVEGARDSPQPADLPLDSIHRREEFVAVLQSWLARDQERRIARARIDDTCAQGNHYSVDRLVAAANAFDQLPESAVPKAVALTPAVAAAKQACEEIVGALPPCDERQSLLSALGRLGTASLKQKVRHRASIIIAAASGRFPDLDFVCNQAVNCRNHFVHGSDFDFELEAPSSNQSFLTDTLEFVFIASELIEAGWDLGRFLDTPTSMSHPFGSYRIHYAVNLHTLRASAIPRADKKP
jgi:hypothetical protein